MTRRTNRLVIMGKVGDQQVATKRFWKCVVKADIIFITSFSLELFCCFVVNCSEVVKDRCIWVCLVDTGTCIGQRGSGKTKP